MSKTIYKKIYDEIIADQNLKRVIQPTVGSGNPLNKLGCESLGNISKDNKEAFFSLDEKVRSYAQLFLSEFWKKGDNLQSTINYHSGKVTNFAKNFGSTQTTYPPSCVSFTLFQVEHQAVTVGTTLTGSPPYRS